MSLTTGRGCSQKVRRRQPNQSRNGSAPNQESSKGYRRMHLNWLSRMQCSTSFRISMSSPRNKVPYRAYLIPSLQPSTNHHNSSLFRCSIDRSKPPKSNLCSEGFELCIYVQLGLAFFGTDHGSFCAVKSLHNSRRCRS